VILLSSLFDSRQAEESLLSRTLWRPGFGRGAQLGARSGLAPFKPKADTDYVVGILGGRRRHTRRHEKLVNDCAAWLETQGLEPGRNAAVDLGVDDPSVVIEAKMIGTSWAPAIRAAVGQLYEYRHFKVADREAGLVFLASKPLPSPWLAYLERDRGIGSMWPNGKRFHLSRRATEFLEL